MFHSKAAPTTPIPLRPLSLSYNTPNRRKLHISVDASIPTLLPPSRSSDATISPQSPFAQLRRLSGDSVPPGGISGQSPCVLLVAGSHSSKFILPSVCGQGSPVRRISDGLQWPDVTVACQQQQLTSCHQTPRTRDLHRHMSHCCRSIPPSEICTGSAARPVGCTVNKVPFSRRKLASCSNHCSCFSRARNVDCSLEASQPFLSTVATSWHSADTARWSSSGACWMT